jgi:hypothetical protein
MIHRAVAYEGAIDLVEELMEGGFDTSLDELPDEAQADASNLISASRAWRREHA